MNLKVIVEGQETQVLLDSGSQLSAISWTWVKRLKLRAKTTPIHFAWIEGSRGFGSSISGLCGGSS